MALLKSTFKLAVVALIFFTIFTLAYGLPGSRLHKHKSSDGRLCDRCLPGWGLVSLCNGTQPSVCTPCPRGTWSPHHPHLQACRSCSKCGKGLYVDKKCRSAADTKCGWCSAEKGHFNIDFIKKCLMRHDVPANEQSAALRLFFEEEKKEVFAEKADIGDVHHRLWLSEKDGVERHRKVILKPSFHEYDVNKMVSAHRRKVFILVGLTGVILVSTLVFAACFLHQYCSSGKSGHKLSNQRLYMQLTEEQNSMIRESAERLEKQRLSRLASCNSQDYVLEEDDFWEDDPLKITENPLEKLLISPKLGSTEDIHSSQKTEFDSEKTETT